MNSEKIETRGLMQLEEAYAVAITNLVECVDSKKIHSCRIAECINTDLTERCCRQLGASREKY
jgi:hypothetical protein